MRYFCATVALIGTVLLNSQSRAVELEDCSKFWFNQKTDCMERNVALLNSAFQAVTAELRKSAKELEASVNDLKSAGFVAIGDKVQLQSNRFNNPNIKKCADEKSPMFPDGNGDFVLSADCTDDDGQRWTIQR